VYKTWRGSVLRCSSCFFNFVWLRGTKHSRSLTLLLRHLALAPKLRRVSYTHVVPHIESPPRKNQKTCPEFIARGYLFVHKQTSQPIERSKFDELQKYEEHR
jgi:hypothetical protein